MESTFFPGAGRRITVGSPTLLVGKNKTRKIRLPITMPLTGESFTSMPDWIGEAFEAVSNFASEMTPDVQEIPDIAITFKAPTKEANGALFETEVAKIAQGELKKFNVCRSGESENPDVDLKFVVYAPFARELWRWLGEMAGEEVKMHFPSGKPAVDVAQPDQQGELIPAEQSVANVQEFFVAPEAPTEGPGSEQFEQEVRESMGAPEPLSEAPRLVRTDQPEKANAKSDKARKAFKDYHTQEVGAGRSVN